MPVALNGSIPLPSIRVYTSASVLLVSLCLYYAVNVTSDPFWRQQSNATATAGVVPPSTVLSGSVATEAAAAAARDVAAGAAAGVVGNGVVGNKLDSLLTVKEINDFEEKILAATDADLKKMMEQEAELLERSAANDSRTIGAHLKDIASFMGSEPICIWTLINMAYCCLILLGKSIQKVVFGELRISEQQHMKDKFWNFIFYKFIFVFGVVNVQYLHEVILWVSWFSVLGFLHLLSQLSKDRFEYLSFSPTTPGWSHFRLIALLSAILTLSGFMLIVSIGVGVFISGVNTFAFMAAECVLLSIRTLHVLIRYAMFLYDMRQGGITHESAISWDKRGPVAYYIELIFEVAALVVDFGHHLHMLLWSNIFLSMASLVIIMQLRYLINEIQRKIKKHRNYLWVLNHMEKSYPLATAEDLKQNCDNCAICWEKMETARKLPCSHLFHNSCLQSWLEQDTSCPTCRLGLSVHNNNVNILPNEIRIDDTEPAGRTANNHFFHFNGSRYVSWLPNFSVEVTHINSVLRNEPSPRETAVNHTSQIRNMARHVQEMFPRFPLSTLIADLQISRSIEVTIDNILEGRLQVPARFQEFDDLDDDSATTANTTTNGNDGNSTSATMSNINSFNSSQPETPDSASGLSGFPAITANDYYVNADEFSPSNHYGGGGGGGGGAGGSESNMSTLSSIGSSSGYEVERSTNIFGNFDNLLRDESFDDVPLGDRFSKSSEERERILQRRKEQLLVIARRKYLEKNKSELNQSPAAAGYSQGDAIRHRNKSCMEEQQPSTPLNSSSTLPSSSSLSSSATATTSTSTVGSRHSTSFTSDGE
ncbi:E3 ubiquitin-protein ligase AMFR isoform X1 [Aedes albopictus]|uniref:E3 ubiquitin-protein ligase amfr n=1 Tax=Aedes albopictus TaxID=7160 RepID=A0ABM1XU45_AEDAL|nr:E3 ubiquitin-protein ligase AMFR-like isoform X1 [Aedes albopictus]XP_029725862.1 E3 ubiquitin-protein ligase AMFR-like isoform X1 [Aedes albopictus]XP_029725863.1 E3 ubiquitin-protein ligase AMFR-like isoform X1 [Aedes albopictus]XP_029725864.1 E3 ubiquitin-protein ligase AMFR-like isoform X1 [Aedes albopictus]